MAEHQRWGAYVGLAAASALVVLIASGVAVSRLASDDELRRHSEAAPATGAPGSAAEPDSPAAAGETAAAAGGTTAAGAALPSTSAPVPPPAPARCAGGARSGRSTSSPAGSPVSEPAAASDAERAVAAGRPAGDQSSGSSPRAGSTSEAGRGDSEFEESPGGDSAPEESPGGASPPAPDGEPGSSRAVAASVSAGEGPSGVVIGAGIGNSPDADLTVGTAQLVGDAPPANGTGVALDGGLLDPPPTVPVLPG